MKLTYEEQKEKAKAIAKLFRKNGIRCGVLRGNGSTEPNNPKNYPVYFVINPDNWYYRDAERKLLYLSSFEIDGQTCHQIKQVLDKEKIEYQWDGDEYSCFIFDVNAEKAKQEIESKLLEVNIEKLKS